MNDNSFDIKNDYSEIVDKNTEKMLHLKTNHESHKFIRNIFIVINFDHTKEEE